MAESGCPCYRSTRLSFPQRVLHKFHNLSVFCRKLWNCVKIVEHIRIFGISHITKCFCGVDEHFIWNGMFSWFARFLRTTNLYSALMYSFYIPKCTKIPQFSTISTISTTPKATNQLSDSDIAGDSLCAPPKHFWSDFHIISSKKSRLRQKLKI